LEKNRDTYFDSTIKIIVYSPYRASKFTDKGLFSSEGHIPPALALLHEMAHAQSYIKDPKKHKIDGETKTPNDYKHKEEEDVIRNIEHPATIKLGLKTIRHGHIGDFYDTISPISIVEKTE